MPSTLSGHLAIRSCPLIEAPENDSGNECQDGSLKTICENAEQWTVCQ